MVLGMGFTFDDHAASKGIASSTEQMRNILKAASSNQERIFPYIGGEEINDGPTHSPRRHIIDFGEMDLEQVRNRYPTLLEGPSVETGTCHIMQHKLLPTCFDSRNPCCVVCPGKQQVQSNCPCEGPQWKQRYVLFPCCLPLQISDFKLKERKAWHFRGWRG